jgi:hypothetical protein
MQFMVVPQQVTEKPESKIVYPLRFEMPRCVKHLLVGHKWWCRKCDKETESQFRDVMHEFWKIKGEGDRIVDDVQS